MARYSPEVKAEIKKMYIQDGISAKEISNLPGMPTHQCISKWAEKYGWKSEREKHETELYENLSPQSQAQKILAKINVLLSTDNKSFTTKDADAIAKLQSALRQIVDKRYHIPMMYQVLTDYLKFLKTNYPDLLNEKIINSVRHFKNDLKERLGTIN